MSTPNTEVENTMHDRCKSVVVFHNNLTKFFKSLKGVLPEYVEQIRVAVKYYKSTPRADYLQEVHALMDPHIKYISEYDDGIFTDDYQKGERFLLPKMDFREIWDLLNGDDFSSDTELQAKTKKSIFNHIQSIYVSVQMGMEQVNMFNKNIDKQKTFLMDMLENLQLDDKIKERIEEMKQQEESEAANSGFNLGKIGEIMGEDNFVFQLAKDITEELDIGTTDIDNPVEAITSLFADNGKKLQELIVTVGDKIEKKVQSGEIDKEKLVSDAQAMKDKIEGFMGKIPGLEEVMNNNGLVQQFMDAFNELDEAEQEQFNYIPPLLEKNLLEWSDEEKQQFDGFAKHIMTKQGVNFENGSSEQQTPESE